MDKTTSFQQFLTSQSIEVDIVQFAINLIITAILAYILKRLFISFANTNSNKNYFANNFVLLAMTTMLIITIVKSSLALSLGLVGALSIVRFRAPIKEPEELVYLFLTIAIGLGLGAGQRLITLVAFTMIALILLITYKRKKSYIRSGRGMLLVISSKKKEIVLNTVTEILKKYCETIDLQRYDHSINRTEISFIVDVKNPEDIGVFSNEIQKIDSTISINLMDYQDLNEV
ncbi:DUF4956 domain-containing protein [Alphaproteobacteria bacterium]|nr:DUF4956 domain-containing protein [Alphaproteobacteria bacterium]